MLEHKVKPHKRWVPQNLPQELFMQQLPKTNAWCLIWLDKEHKLGIKSIQDPRATHIGNCLAASSHIVFTGKITLSGNHADMEMWRPLYVQLACKLSFLGTTNTTHIDNQMKTHFGTKMIDSAYQKRRPISSLHRVTTCWTHWTCIAKLLCFQQWKWYIQSKFDYYWIFLLLLLWWTYSDFDNEPFKLSNIQYYQNNKLVPTHSSQLLQAAEFLSLTFKTQKNCVKCEHICHRCSTPATLCPS